MANFCENQETLFKVIHLVLNDHLPDGPLDMAYLFDLSPENKSSVIDGAVEYYLSGKVRKLALNNEGHPAGSISYDECREKLIAKGVSHNNLLTFKPAREFLAPSVFYSTSSEAEGFARFIKERGFTLVGGIRQPLFQIRGFVSLVSSLFRNGLQATVRAYNITGSNLP